MIVAILYATVEGQTGKIASHLARLAEDHGHQVVLADLAQPGFALPGGFDGAFLCAPIHLGSYPPAFFRFIENWKAELIGIPTALVTVSLAIASKNADEQAEARDYPKLLAQRTGGVADWTHHAAGALKYLEYDFFKRWILRRISQKEGGPVDTSKDYELTNWAALEEFAHDCLGEFAKRRGRAA